MSDAVNRFAADVYPEIVINYVPCFKSWVPVVGHKLMIGSKQLFIFTVHRQHCYICSFVTGERLIDFKYDNLDEFSRVLRNNLYNLGVDLLFDPASHIYRLYKDSFSNLDRYEQLLGVKPDIKVLSKLELHNYWPKIAYKQYLYMNSSFCQLENEF